MVGTSDLQKSRHLQKKSRHGAAQSGHKAKTEVAPGAKKGASRLFWGGGCDFNFRFVPRLCRSVTRLFLGQGVRLQFSLCAPIVPLRDATFLQMTRLLQVTKITKKHFLCPTSNRYHSTRFVKTSAPGFPSSRTAVLTDFLQMTRLLQVTYTSSQASRLCGRGRRPLRCASCDRRDDKHAS